MQDSLTALKERRRLRGFERTSKLHPAAANVEVSEGRKPAGEHSGHTDTWGGPFEAFVADVACQVYAFPEDQDVLEEGWPQDWSLKAGRFVKHVDEAGDLVDIGPEDHEARQHVPHPMDTRQSPLVSSCDNVLDVLLPASRGELIEPSENQGIEDAVTAVRELHKVSNDSSALQPLPADATSCELPSNTAHQRAEVAKADGAQKAYALPQAPDLSKAQPKLPPAGEDPALGRSDTAEEEGIGEEGVPQCPDAVAEATIEKVHSGFGVTHTFRVEFSSIDFADLPLTGEEATLCWLQYKLPGHAKVSLIPWSMT